MKKLLSILLAAMLIVACFGMVGCGVQGTWKFYAYEIAGVEYKVGDTYAGVTITEEMVKDIGFEFAKDGVVKDLEGNVEEGMTWEKTDDGVSIKAAGVEVSKLVKDGNKLIMESYGMKIILKK